MAVRVRFAPSPTGALHIGGVRTALYNYLFARQQNGVFILRIEDTDQNRFVPGAEAYILEALQWLGLEPDEGVGYGGPHAPYRQSDRKEIYHEYALRLVQSGHAYYAFDKPEELETERQAQENFTYNASTRSRLNNSLTLTPEETQNRLAAGEPYVIRLLVQPDREVHVHDLIRGHVIFQSNELDDKVLLKADGMPTYHLANIVDDHLMEISHVIRGEEWLSSTAHHVLLYEAFGWTDTMPQFAHLPLILKPIGNGKLSKRDGAKFGIPVFPLSWQGEEADDRFDGFREVGFLPEAVLNFLALLGWHTDTDQEIFSMEELIHAFSIEHIGKSGARFDYEKAKWFNQKYIQAMPNNELAARIRPWAEKQGYNPSDELLEEVASALKERVTVLPDFVQDGYYFFEPVRVYDLETVRKKWTAASEAAIANLAEIVQNMELFTAHILEQTVKEFMHEHKLKPGDLLPLLRIALTGGTKGPGVFETAYALGRDETQIRLRKAAVLFSENSTNVK